MPDRNSRKKIIDIHLSKMAASKELSSEWLSSITENYSGADLEMLCREAGMLALREHIRPGMSREELILDEIIVNKDHFEDAFSHIKPHLSTDMLEEYTQMIRDFEV